MYNLLRSKGFAEEDSLDKAIDWLNSKGIYVDLLTMFDPDNNEFVGYSAQIMFSSGSNLQSEEVFYTKEDALTNLLYAIHEYF